MLSARLQENGVLQTSHTATTDGDDEEDMVSDLLSQIHSCLTAREIPDEGAIATFLADIAVFTSPSSGDDEWDATELELDQSFSQAFADVQGAHKDVPDLFQVFAALNQGRV